jgi:hypothetical protein
MQPTVYVNATLLPRNLCKLNATSEMSRSHATFMSITLLLCNLLHVILLVRSLCTCNPAVTQPL